MRFSIRMTGRHYEQLVESLQCSEGHEKVAALFCGRGRTETAEALCVQEVWPLPNHCYASRSSAEATWDPNQLLNEFYQRRRGSGLCLVHTHPESTTRFSKLDDAVDQSLLGCASCFMDDGAPHASMILTPDGRLTGRFRLANGVFVGVDYIHAAGPQLRIFSGSTTAPLVRNKQTYGARTASDLGQLRLGVVGASGIGSPAAEISVRMGVRNLVLVDPGRVDVKNLNRLIHATQKDAAEKRYKVDVVGDSLERSGLVVQIERVRNNLLSPEAIAALKSCDLILSCLDNPLARSQIERLGAYYCIPIVDAGVNIGIGADSILDSAQVRIDYMYPDSPTLLQRGRYSELDLRAWAESVDSPETYRDLVKRGYLPDVDGTEGAPMVATLTCMAAARMVDEVVARVAGFRYRDPCEYDGQEFNLCEGTWSLQAFLKGSHYDAVIGRGDCEPPMDLVG